MSKQHEQSDAANLAKSGQSSEAGKSSGQTQTSNDPADAALGKGHDPVKRSSDPDADAEAERIRRAEADAKVSTDTRRDPNPDMGGARVTINDPASREGMIAQHEQVNRENAQRNERNSEGHEKNLAKAREDAERGHAEYQRTPPTGKQRDVNTPHVLPSGQKVWR